METGAPYCQRTSGERHLPYPLALAGDRACGCSKLSTHVSWYVWGSPPPLTTGPFGQMCLGGSRLSTHRPVLPYRGPCLSRGMGRYDSRPASRYPCTVGRLGTATMKTNHPLRSSHRRAATDDTPALLNMGTPQPRERMGPGRWPPNKGGASRYFYLYYRVSRGFITRQCAETSYARRRPEPRSAAWRSSTPCCT